MKTYIIAEAGTGYARASITERKVLAISYADRARAAGADAVKFQMFLPHEDLFCPMPGDERRWARWNDCFLHFEEWREVKHHCDDIGIDFLASAFQNTAVAWCLRLELKYYKVAYRARHTYPSGMVPGPYLVSAGRSDYVPFGERDYHRLLVVPEYPSPLADSFLDDDKPWCGLSDHSGTVWPGLHAIAIGSPFLEVHFDFYYAPDNPDRAVCISTEDLSILCEFRDAVAERKTNTV